MRNLFVRKVDSHFFTFLTDSFPYVENGVKNQVIFTDRSMYLPYGMADINALLKKIEDLKSSGSKYVIIDPEGKDGYELMGVDILEENPDSHPDKHSRFRAGQTVFVFDSIKGLRKVTINDKLFSNENWYYIISESIVTDFVDGHPTNQINERRLMVEGDKMCFANLQVTGAVLTKKIIDSL